MELEELNDEGFSHLSNNCKYFKFILFSFISIHLDVFNLISFHFAECRNGVSSPEGVQRFPHQVRTSHSDIDEWRLECTDPGHVPFLHTNGIFGSNTKQEAATIHMRLAGDISTDGGFTIEHDGYFKKQQERGMKATRMFIPPGTVRLAFSSVDGAWSPFCTCCLLVCALPWVC